MVIGGPQNTSSNVPSRRDNGIPNESARNGNNNGNRGNATSSPGPDHNPNLYGHFSFQNGVAAHAYINAALSTGNVGTVVAATSLGFQQGPRSGFESTGGSYTFNGTGITRARRDNSFGNIMQIHPMPPPPGMPRTRQTPCPASAMILVAEVQGPPRSSGPGSVMNGFPGLPAPGFRLLGSQSSQSSTSSCECDVCRNCVCHLYCQEHADLNCPVHGRGARSSGSDEERLISSPESSFSC